MIDSFLQNTGYFAVAFSFIVYLLIADLQRRCPRKQLRALINPLLLTVAVTIPVLLAAGVSYETFNEGAKYLSWLLTPTTVCLAIPLYERFSYLKQQPKAIMLGILSGVIASAVSILGMAILFGISQAEFITLLPKSVTTAIGIDLSAELGGYQAITVASIIITGLLGNVSASFVFRLFRITDPIAQGIACGTAAHAMGTSRASELGRTQEAMSSLAMGVAGIMTVVCATLFSVIPV